MSDCVKEREKISYKTWITLPKHNLYYYCCILSATLHTIGLICFVCWSKWFNHSINSHLKNCVAPTMIKLYKKTFQAVIHYNRSTILYRMGDYFSALPGFQKDRNILEIAGAGLWVRPLRKVRSVLLVKCSGSVFLNTIGIFLIQKSHGNMIPFLLTLFLIRIWIRPI